MVKLKLGDTVICTIKDGLITSSYNIGEEKEFKIIALDFKGYFLYVPEDYYMFNTFKISSFDIKSFNINKKFLNEQAIYINESLVNRVKSIIDGFTCSICSEYYQYSESNQIDGTFKCWHCTNYFFYK